MNHFSDSNKWVKALGWTVDWSNNFRQLLCNSGKDPTLLKLYTVFFFQSCAVPSCITKDSKCPHWWTYTVPRECSPFGFNVRLCMTFTPSHSLQQHLNLLQILWCLELHANRLTVMVSSCWWFTRVEFSSVHLTLALSVSMPRFAKSGAPRSSLHWRCVSVVYHDVGDITQNFDHILMES